MRNVTILCLLYGTLTLGIVSVLLYVRFHRDHESSWQKKPQEPATIWKLDKKLQQQAIRGSGQIPRAERPNKDEAKKPKPFLALGNYFEFLC